MADKRLPTYFISHGGGPWPYMKKEFDGKYDILEASLRKMPSELGSTPKAILVISGHWEEKQFTVMASPAPPMVYDYSGFPEYTYHVKYSAPGSPELARQVEDLLRNAGLSATHDSERGFDHGTFSPLAVIYPEAKIPVVQLSLRSGYDPAEHIAVGRALAPLRDDGVLIVGSGLSYHNLRQFGPQAKTASKAFDDWLTEVLSVTGENRSNKLQTWSTAPSARAAHPREDHLIPLMVAVGAAYQDEVTRVYHEENFFGGIVVSSYRFG
jgi:aromatic ring-opening dioxygenase catalytic subunit (LigB family)